MFIRKDDIIDVQTPSNRASSSKVFNLIASPKMIKTPQNFVEGSFPIKMTKICIKVGVKS